MSFTVVYDACVLFPAPLRDLLIRLARTSLVHAKWTDQILDEVFRNILKHRPDLSAARLVRTRELMNTAIRDVMVEGHEGLIEGLQLPDPDDRHVLAAAICSGAQAIVTRNLKDFPKSILKNYGMEAVSPDQFVTDLLDLAPGVVVLVLQEQADSLKSPPTTLGDLMDRLEDNGLQRAMAEARRLSGG